MNPKAWKFSSVRGRVRLVGEVRPLPNGTFSAALQIVDRHSERVLRERRPLGYAATRRAAIQWAVESFDAWATERAEP